MLVCDDEPSPVSSDEVFFICEKQTSPDRDDNNCENCSNDVNDCSSGSDCPETTSKPKRTSSNRSQRSRINKKSPNDDENPEERDKNGKKFKEAESQTSHTILVKIQVENCSHPEKSSNPFPHEPTNSKKENSCKMKNKTVAVQVNFNSIESMVESHCVKISKVRCCNKASLLQSLSKVNKLNPEPSNEKNDNKSTSDSTKIYLWSGKSMKKKTLMKSKSVAEKTKPPLSFVAPTIREPIVQRSNSCVEKSSTRMNKINSGSRSPLNKQNRSSLSIEPDKITINLSKYSPCASRLAASSKILSGSSQLSPDSPLHGASQPSLSPRRLDNSQSVDRSPLNRSEKITLQPSLSLNIHQFQKSHPTPRSRSVGDSCVTSPTSEATTLSYSPTGTEILSLEEVGPQTSFGDHSTSSIVLPPLPPPELKFHRDYSVCARNANLETKC